MNLTKSGFEKTVGLSNGYLNQLRSSPSNEKIEQISNSFPQLNRYWLLTGVGPMLLDVAPPAQVSSVNSAVAMHGNAINTITNESAGGESSVSQELKMAQQKIEALEKLLDEKERLIKVLLDKK
jgi:hypothetical protein